MPRSRSLSRQGRESLAEAFRAAQASDPASAQAFVLTDLIAFVLEQQGHSWAEYGRQVREAGYDAYGGLQRLPSGDATARAADAIAHPTTPFLRYFEEWKPHAGLVPRCLDQACATLKQFASAVRQSIETLEAKHVQAWTDDLINAKGEVGTSAKTVKRKLSQLRNYWRYLQSLGVVPEERLPFDHRRVKAAAESMMNWPASSRTDQFFAVIHRFWSGPCTVRTRGGC